MHTSASDIAYVIGGGPSLRGFDFERLRGLPCFAANGSAAFAPWGFLVSIDRDFIFNATDLIGSFGPRALLAPPDNIRHRNPEATYFFRSKARSLFQPDNPERGASLPGLNSGFAAMGAAVRAGYKKIALLGIDMRPNTGHFHQGYVWNPGTDGITSDWIKDFDDAAEEAAARGVQIANFSENSAVRGFPKYPLELLFCDIFK